MLDEAEIAENVLFHRAADWYEVRARGDLAEIRAATDALLRAARKYAKHVTYKTGSVDLNTDLGTPLSRTAQLERIKARDRTSWLHPEDDEDVQWLLSEIERLQNALVRIPLFAEADSDLRSVFLDALGVFQDMQHRRHDEDKLCSAEQGTLRWEVRQLQEKRATDRKEARKLRLALDRGVNVHEATAQFIEELLKRHKGEAAPWSK